VASLALVAGTLGLVPAGPFRAVEPAPAVTYKLSAAPVASFRWFPSTPRVGERFSLVSTSSDLMSPIVGFAWDVADNGPFGPFLPGGPTSSAVFSTPADHVVRLRVTAADHLSSVAAATIHMSDPPPSVLQPFPTVRIVGRFVRRGIRLSILRVKAPAEARINVNCRGRGCPVKAERRIATARAVRFPAFQRYLRAGVSLTVRVSKDAKIGAYTRFAVRHHKLPVRADSCLDPAGIKPIPCPSE
jgi:hypothetical protein